MVNKDLDYLILKALKKEQGYISGEELAKALKISRQALWKHIGKLTGKGYEIVAVPHLGYRLISCPDKLYPWEIQYKLKTKFIGKNVYYFKAITSTQDIAWKLGLQNFSQGTLVVSERQRRGRGRLQRKWVSAEGGIYISLIIRPDILIQEIPKITLLVGLGCVYGIRKSTAMVCSLKWPNDILLADKKLGGVLCEVNAEQDRVNFVILGIGINVNTKDLPPQATSLFLYAKKKFRRTEILKSVLEEIERLYIKVKEEGFSFMLKEWEKFSSLWAKRARVKIFNREIEGEVVGIDEKGYLLLRKDNGFVEEISAGEVIKVNVN